jgi:hypothetical protein
MEFKLGNFNQHREPPRPPFDTAKARGTRPEA